jgi:hypothetical protein
VTTIPLNPTKLFNLALYLTSLGHFIALIASAQVPGRLGWKTDLPKLASFNRKLTWTYFAFTVFTIFGLGVVTLVLHDELLRGDLAALSWAGVMAGFWFARILVDVL